MPLVSVVMPTYNRAGLVAESIASVLDQTYGDFELIVVDDGSTDDTPEVLALFGPPVKVIRQANGGPSAAKNTGMRAAAGRLIALIDSDDLWLPDKLERQVEFLDVVQDVGFVFTDISRFDTRGTRCESRFDRLELFRRQPYAVVFDRHCVMTDDVFDYLLAETPIYVPTVVFRRELLDRVGGFDESIRLSEDWEFWMRLARETRFGFTDEALVRVREHEGNVSGDLAERLLGEIGVLDHVLRTHSRLTDEHKATIERQAAQRRFEVAYEYFKRNDLAAVAEQCDLCLRRDPAHAEARRLARWAGMPGWVVRSLRAGRTMARQLVGRRTTD